MENNIFTEGIFPGVGSVLSFVPIIGGLFFLLSLLEQSGCLSYICRLLDRPMRLLGLSGSAIIPMIIGFGCNVPAILSASSILHGREKFAVMAMLPFMSCSARLPIYAMFTAVFFEKYRLPVFIAIYGLGIGAAVITALVLKQVSKGFWDVCLLKTPHPANGRCNCDRKGNRRPGRKSSISDIQKAPGNAAFFAKIIACLSTALKTAWQSCLGFVKKAFTVILLASVVVWVLRTYDATLQPVSEPAESLLAILGRTFAPLFAPCGFGDWRAVSAIISGLFAKEAVISTFAVLAGAAYTNDLSLLLAEVFTPLSAFCFMTFCLLYTPCIATLTAIKKETGSLRFCFALTIFQMGLAWLVSLLIFQGGEFILTY